MSKEINYITVTPFYRFGKCDEHNFVLEEFREVHAKKNRFLTEARTTEKWVEAGFYSNVADVVKAIIKKSGDAEAEVVNDLKSIVRKMEAIADQACQVVAGSGINLESFDKPVDGRGRKTAVAEADAVSTNPKKEKAPAKEATLSRAQEIAKQAKELKKAKKTAKVSAKVKPVAKAKRGRPSKK